MLSRHINTSLLHVAYRSISNLLYTKLIKCMVVLLDNNKYVRLCVGPGGRPRLWVRGRSFYAAHTMRSGVVRWRCTMGGCGCKAYTQKGTLHKLVGEHNHVGRCGRRPSNINPQSTLMASISAPASGSSSPPTPLLVPRLPNFDPSAWLVRY